MSLFFDLDGALIDSAATIRECLDEALTEHALEPLDDGELRRLIGPPLETGLPLLLHDRGVGTGRTEHLLLAFRERYRVLALEATRVQPGVEEVLDTLGTRHVLVLVTSKPEAITMRLLDELRLRRHFTAVVAQPAGAPVPKSVLLARALDVVRADDTTSEHAARSWMVGDRHHDIEAARAIGMRSAGVLWGYGDREELERAGATALAATPSELLEVLVA